MKPRSLASIRSRHGLGAAVVGAAALIAACGGGSGDGAAGSVRLHLTDAPACGYDEVNVTVERVRVHAKANAGANEAGWSELVLSPARRVDLLDLTNGVLEELGTLPLPAGSYTQVRLVLSPNSGADPLANSVRPTGGVEQALTTPSAQQSGTKIQANFSVAANQVADLVLDFDACRSLVAAGNSGQILLKPVISATPVFAAAGNAIQGHVDASLVGVTVSAQQGGAVRRSTVPDATGRFVLSPLAVGSYEVVLGAQGRATAVLTGVPVTETARTTLGSTGAALPLAAASAPATVSGLVSRTGTAAIPDATVRAVQRLSGGPEVEIGARQVDLLGAYSLSLPVAPPGRAAYAASAPATYTFVPDAAAAARYRLEARAEGLATQGADIDISSGNLARDFVFP